MTVINSIPPMPPRAPGPPALPHAQPAAAAAAPAPESAAAPPAEAAGEMLRQVLGVFERDGVQYCVTHAYERFPQHVEHDVDCVVPRKFLPRRLAALLKRNEPLIGGRIVQWFEERANFVVIEARGDASRGGAGAGTGAPEMLQLHVSADFEVNNRVIARGDDLLATRRPYLGCCWVPAPHVEFACVLANRINKRSLDAAHTRQLSALWAAEPIKCSEELAAMFNPPSVTVIAAAALRNEWDAVIAILPRLRREMMVRLVLAQPLSYIGRVADKYLRRLKRWTRPHAGLHVVFLGPDGVGKSTVIDAVQQRVAPAFLRTTYQSFARGLLPYRKKPSPHALPPRSLPASLIKAAWWLACYTIGYYWSVRPTLIRGGVVLNHRYLLDALVDPRRYRYSGPMALLRAIWRVAPKPDLIIVLDAPPDVVHARKRETTLEETTRQRDAYLALARTLPNAQVVDTSTSPEATIDEVTRILLDHMAASVARRMNLDRPAREATPA